MITAVPDGPGGRAFNIHPRLPRPARSGAGQARGSRIRRPSRGLPLHEPGQVLEGLVPALHGRFHRDRLRQPFLHDLHFRPARHISERDGDLDLALHQRVVAFELVRVVQPLVGFALEVPASEEVRVLLVEGREAHPVQAANLGLELVHVGRVPVRRHPLGHGVGVEERVEHAFAGRLEDAGQSHRTCRPIALCLGRCHVCSSPFDFHCDVVQHVLPEDPVLHDPRERGGQGARLEGASTHPPRLRLLQEADLLQRPEVLGDGREAHVVRRRQLAHRALAFGELLDDRAPNRVGEGREHVVEPDPLNLKHQLNCHARRILKRFLNNTRGSVTRRLCRTAVRARPYSRLAGAPPVATRFMRMTAKNVATLTPNTIQNTDEMDWAKASWRTAAPPDGAPARSTERSEANRLIWMAPRSETPMAPPRFSVKVARPEAIPISLRSTEFWNATIVAGIIIPFPKPIGRHTVMSWRIDEEDRIEVMSKIPTELIAEGGRAPGAVVPRGRSQPGGERSPRTGRSPPTRSTRRWTHPRTIPSSASRGTRRAKKRRANR